MEVGIIGTGKIGSDLLDKVMQSEYLDCVMFAGRRESPGIMRARGIGIPTSTSSVDAILESKAKIVFDATNAKSHLIHAPLLTDRFVVDLTPSRVGKMCVPTVNLQEAIKEKNVNMVTCGGQAMTAKAKEIMQAHSEIEYMEIISAIASVSAGMGTRENIDEYTQTTSDVLVELAGVPRAKAIIILNPAEPPITMRNTLIYEVDGRIERITRMIETNGNLPGNLDIINQAAIVVAEAYAKR